MVSDSGPVPAEWGRAGWPPFPPAGCRLAPWLESTEMTTVSLIRQQERDTAAVRFGGE